MVNALTINATQYNYAMYLASRFIVGALHCIHAFIVRAWQKLVDGPLMAKWKKPGYERLCSTYVINTKNYKFGTVSICRVSEG